MQIYRFLKKLSLKMEVFVYPLVGLPSYQKYLASYSSKYPNCPPKSREEFYKEAFEHRYGSNGAKKCC